MNEDLATCKILEPEPIATFGIIMTEEGDPTTCEVNINDAGDQFITVNLFKITIADKRYSIIIAQNNSLLTYWHLPLNNCEEGWPLPTFCHAMSVHTLAFTLNWHEN